MSQRRRTSSVKIRNKKYDKLISIISASVLLLCTILFITLPLIKLEIPGFVTKQFRGYELIFGLKNYIKINWIALIVGLILVTATVLNIIGIFDRRFCLFSGMSLVLVVIMSIFIKSSMVADASFSNFLDLKFKNMFTIYLLIALLFVPTFGQLYITTSEEF